MELDELKIGWQALERRVAALEVQVPASGASPVHAELRPLVVGQSVQMVFGVVLAMAAGTFWFDHRDAPGPLVAGLLLHLYGIAMIVAAARNLVLAARARASAPLLELQARVAELRAWRIREGRWFGVVGCFMWVPMIVWGFGLAGVDIVAARPGYVGWNLLTAGVCLGVYLVVRRLGKVPEGASVRRARERLAEVERFARGE
ncbi:hypothetical protein L2Y94_04945 [Luteibacter aegosomatis]|uniref:hypothetical protein n=1 Tax=Luteibacter aegosomatis TaxID=2911537 RepID=UPI001FF96BD4|nr:hypothetical protein [Luteibacter aegosomatis]UPG86704.1 hypothetical protein L2Y94_04945 [Luteibacter aegosomatis]